MFFILNLHELWFRGFLSFYKVLTVFVKSEKNCFFQSDNANEIKLKSNYTLYTKEQHQTKYYKSNYCNQALYNFLSNNSKFNNFSTDNKQITNKKMANTWNKIKNKLNIKRKKNGSRSNRNRRSKARKNRNRNNPNSSPIMPTKQQQHQPQQHRYRVNTPKAVQQHRNSITTLPSKTSKRRATKSLFGCLTSVPQEREQYNVQPQHRMIVHNIKKNNHNTFNHNDRNKIMMNNMDTKRINLVDNMDHIENRKKHKNDPQQIKSSVSLYLAPNKINSSDEMKGNSHSSNKSKSSSSSSSSSSKSTSKSKSRSRSKSGQPAAKYLQSGTAKVSLYGTPELRPTKTYTPKQD